MMQFIFFERKKGAGIRTRIRTGYRLPDACYPLLWATLNKYFSGIINESFQRDGDLCTFLFFFPNVALIAFITWDIAW